MKIRQPAPLIRACVALLVVAVVACSNQGDEVSTSDTPVPTTAPTEVQAAQGQPTPLTLDLNQPTAQAEVPSETQVIATVNGDEITYGALNREIEGIMAQQLRGQQVPPALLQQFRSQLEPQAFQQLVLKKQLRKYAEEHGLVASATRVEAQMEDIRSRFPTQDELDDALASQGMTQEGLESDIEDQQLLMATVEYYLDQQPEPSAEDIQQHYEQNLESYKIPQQVTASHILIKFAPGETESPEKLQQAQDLRQQIVEEDADFAEMARQHSEGPSSARGGMLGAFSKGDMVPPFEEAAFTMEPGDISEIVQTQFGYHIIKVHGKTEASTPSLEQVRERIIDNIQQQEVDAWMQELVAQADVERLDQ